METIALITKEDIRTIIREELERIINPKEDKWCIGQNELAKQLGLTKETISRKTQNGEFNGCYKRIGRKIIYNLTKIKSL